MQAIDAGPSQVRPSSMVPYPIYIVTWVKWENVDWIFLFRKQCDARLEPGLTDLAKIGMLTAQPPHLVRLLPLFFLNSQLFTSVGEDLSVAFDVFFLVRKLLRPLMMCWRHQMVPHFTFWLNQGNTVCFLRLQTVLKAWKLAWPFLRIHKVQCDNLDCRQIHALDITTPC